MMPIDPLELRKKILAGLTSPIVQVLDSKGITVEHLADKLKEELEATEVKTFCNKGDVVHSDPLIAWEIRQRARESAHKLRGDFIERKQISIDGTLQAVPLTKEQQAELDAMKEAILLQTKKGE